MGPARRARPRWPARRLVGQEGSNDGENSMDQSQAPHCLMVLVTAFSGPQQGWHREGERRVSGCCLSTRGRGCADCTLQSLLLVPHEVHVEHRDHGFARADSLLGETERGGRCLRRGAKANELLFPNGGGAMSGNLGSTNATRPPPASGFNRLADPLGLVRPCGFFARHPHDSMLFPLVSCWQRLLLLLLLLHAPVGRSCPGGVSSGLWEPGGSTEGAPRAAFALAFVTVTAAAAAALLQLGRSSLWPRAPFPAANGLALISGGGSVARSTPPGGLVV